MAQDYSDWLQQKTDVGISETYYDSVLKPNAKYDPGIVSSNGFRYSYLKYRAETVSKCSIAGVGVTYTTAYVGDDTNSLTSNIK